MENNVFNYKGNNITLKKENGKVYANATEMAKSFNKRTSDWLNTKQSNELITSLSAVTGIPATGLVVVNQGGINQGTWMHEDVALLFAQWLSPDFYILCNSKIKELLKQGYTTLDNINRKELARMILEQEEEKERLTEQNRLQERQLKEAAPKIEYFEKALSSTGTFTATQIAKEFGWGAETLNRKLKELGVQYKQNGQWIFYAKYDGKGYTKSVTRTFTRTDGTTGSQMQTVFTEKGRKFIHELLNSNFKNGYHEKRRCFETGF